MQKLVENVDKQKAKLLKYTNLFLFVLLASVRLVSNSLLRSLYTTASTAEPIWK